MPAQERRDESDQGRRSAQGDSSGALPETLLENINVMLTNLQGQYTVLADVLTESGDKITCLTAKIAFHR